MQSNIDQIHSQIIYRWSNINHYCTFVSVPADVDLVLTHSHDFLKVYYGSEVKAQPDLLQGDAAAHVFTVGHYTASGTPLELTDVHSRGVTVRPRQPFTVSSKLWSECHRGSVWDIKIVD